MKLEKMNRRQLLAYWKHRLAELRAQLREAQAMVKKHGATL